MSFLHLRIGLPLRHLPDTIPSYTALTGKSLLFRWPNHVSFLRFTRVDTDVNLTIVSKVLIEILPIFLLFVHVLMMLF